MRILRQIHQQASRDTDLGRKPRAFRADRILQHLHQQQLALVQVLLDRLNAGVGTGLPEVGNVQERGAFEADVDEGRLHAGQHPGDDADVDVPDQTARGFAIEMQFLQHSLVHDGDPEFLRSRVDQDIFFHGAVMDAWDSLPCAAAGQFRKAASP